MDAFTSPRQLRRAFTLIELLVVISIIAVLVALLLPALQSARQVARSTGCQSNLRQIGMGVIMFNDDHGWVPRGRTFDLNDPQQTHAWRHLFPDSHYSGHYLNSDEVLKCPSHRPFSRDGRRTSYNFNYSIPAGTDLNDHGAVRYPSETLMVGDAANSWMLPDRITHVWRHMGAGCIMNIVFLDGHVQGLTRWEVWQRSTQADSGAYSWRLHGRSILWQPHREPNYTTPTDPGYYDSGDGDNLRQCEVHGRNNGEYCPRRSEPRPPMPR